jgi:transposase
MMVLRRIMAIPAEPVQQVIELGIDDFAFRRGRKYGTILVDMCSHKVIDVLPDRSAATSAAWMATHPEIEAGRVEIEEGTMHQPQRLLLPRPSSVRTGFIS